MTTLLLDDSFKKAILQPYNHVVIKEYTREMRNADVASLAIETRRAQLAANASTKEDAEADTLASSASPPPHESSLGVSAPVVDGSAVQGELSKKQKKRAKKARQKLEQADEEPDEGEVVYDETLLAIIGILNESKVQSNVAAWVRSGGLWGPYASSMQEQQSGGKNSGSPTEGNAKSAKRKGRLDEGEVGNSGNGEAADVPLGEESEEKSEGGPPVWYEHPGTMIYWSAKGREALTELGIEIRHGLSS